MTLKERQNQKNHSADDHRVALVASVIYTLQKFKVVVTDWYIPDVFDAVVKGCCHLLIPRGGQKGHSVLPLLESSHVPQRSKEPQPTVGDPINL